MYIRLLLICINKTTTTILNLSTANLYISTLTAFLLLLNIFSLCKCLDMNPYKTLCGWTF